MAKFAFEHLNARMDDDAGADETTIDVDIQVADRTEEASSIVEEAATVAADAEASDDVAEEIESLEHMRSVIQQHGLTPGMMALINRDNRLSIVSGRSLAAAESLDATGRNHSEAQAAMEAISDTISKGWEAVKKFFRKIGEKIKALWGKIMDFFTSWETSIKRAKERISGITVDAKKAGEHKAKLITPKDHNDLGEACKTILKTLNSENSASKLLEKKDYFTDAFSDATLKPVGLKRDDGVLVAADGALEAKEMSVTESGWTVEYAKGKGFELTSTLVASIRTGKKMISVVDNLVKAGIAAAESAEKSSGADGSSKETVTIARKNASDFSKLVGKVAGRATFVPRAYVTACGALYACRG
jgi:hypothetical protein